MNSLAEVQRLEKGEAVRGAGKDGKAAVLASLLAFSRSACSCGNTLLDVSSKNDSTCLALLSLMQRLIHASRPLVLVAHVNALSVPPVCAQISVLSSLCACRSVVVKGVGSRRWRGARRGAWLVVVASWVVEVDGGDDRRFCDEELQNIDFSSTTLTVCVESVMQPRAANCLCFRPEGPSSEKYGLLSLDALSFTQLLLRSFFVD